jgi:sarcosine oxidase subunit beta
MNESADAIVIGAGIIGCATAFELAKKGYKTLSIDKLPDAGYGSTSNSCAIVRFHYSTREGIAMAYDGYFYWKDWPTYLGAEDERGLARYRETGMLVLKNEPDEYYHILKHFDDLGVPYEVWDNETIMRRYPFGDGLYGPPKLPNDPAFWDEPAARCDRGRHLQPAGGLRHRSATRHAQPDAGGRGQRRAVPVQPRGRRSPPGQWPGRRCNAH